MEKEKTITETIEEIKETICDSYCRYSYRYSNAEYEEVLERFCSECPLTKL